MNDLVKIESSELSVNEEIKKNKLIRKSRLDAAQDYIGFITANVVGLGLFGVGVSETFFPEFLAAVIPFSWSLGGAGLAILAGKRLSKPIIDALANVVSK